MKPSLRFTSLFCVLLQSITTAQPANNLFAVQGGAEAAPVYDVLEVNIGVIWYNELARYDACNDDENQLIADMITPNLNFQLNRNGIASLPWQAERGNKNGRNQNNNNNNSPNNNNGNTNDNSSNNNNNNRELNDCYNCKYVQQLPDSWCNSLYNCGFRRMLRIERKAGAKVDLHALGLKFNYICMSELAKLATNRLLSDTCKAAVNDALCETHFPE